MRRVWGPDRVGHYRGSLCGSHVGLLRGSLCGSISFLGGFSRDALGIIFVRAASLRKCPKFKILKLALSSII